MEYVDEVVYEKKRGLDVAIKYGYGVVSKANVAYPIGGRLEEGRVSDRVLSCSQVWIGSSFKSQRCLSYWRQA